MKKAIVILIALFVLTLTAQTVKREARGVWMSAYVSDWPSGAITTSNAATMKKACQKMLDTLAVNNMNVVYFHVRAMCDALYNSAYEPWSSYCSTARGVAPAFDPLEFIVQEAHKRGIELYAWVNPYRYKPRNRDTWGDDPRNYENSHPEWLLATDYETVLNPGIPEVRQRVVDVCRDIISKYDVDGLVFDDYFYNQDNPSMTLDAEQYNAYLADGGTMSQADWRRENVNQMVHDVNQMVKQTKPWVRFGISPAGVACSSPAVAAQYGVEPSPGSDWQYNQIYSDPMAWITRGTIDFISPQVYWNTTGTYDEVTNWWGMVGHKFNRHVYISGYARESAVTGWDLPEYLLQVNVMRQAMTSGVYGMIYFKYTTWRNFSQTLDGRVTQLRHYLKRYAFNTPAICPVPAWLKPDRDYTTVSDVRLDGDSLRWTPEHNVRYVVYAIPDSVADAQFRCQPDYMLGISYSPAYGIDAAHRTGYRYAVTILDRWENEYSPVMLGATPQQAPKPVIVTPDDGSTVSRLGMLRWSAPGATLFTVEVYDDAALTSQVTRVEVDSASLPISALNGLNVGQQYWWRVVARGVNLWDNASEARAMTLGAIAITSPAVDATDVSLTPTIIWNDLGGGTNYLLELSTAASMGTVKYSVTTSEPNITVPAYVLAGATTYYARLTATQGQLSEQSPVVAFRTVEVIPQVPVVLVPAVDGGVLYGTSRIQVQPQAGITSLRVEVSASSTFPTRQTYKGTVTDGSFSSVELQDITGVGRQEDGNTYYVRTRFAYLTVATGSTTQYTDYSPVMTYVYRASQPGDVTGDGQVDIADVNAVINMMLGKAEPLPTGDVTGDGGIDIADVNAIINNMLGK